MPNEVILCAAIWYNGLKHLNQPLNIDTGLVFAGYRHPSCIAQIAAAYYPNFQNDTLQNDLRVKILRNSKQGFLTSKNRFIDRKEGAILAIENKQIEKLNTPPDLYSDDLY